MEGRGTGFDRALNAAVPSCLIVDHEFALLPHPYYLDSMSIYLPLDDFSALQLSNFHSYETLGLDVKSNCATTIQQCNPRPIQKPIYKSKYKWLLTLNCDSMYLLTKLWHKMLY